MVYGIGTMVYDVSTEIGIKCYVPISFLTIINPWVRTRISYLFCVNIHSKAWLIRLVQRHAVSIVRCALLPDNLTSLAMRQSI